MKLLKDLALALLNATLLLAIVLVVCALILVNRVSQLSENTADMVASLIAPQTERIREISGRIQKLESLLDGGAARSQQLESAVSELRGALPPVADLECVARQTLAAELVHQAGQSLRARRPAQ